MKRNDKVLTPHGEIATVLEINEEEQFVIIDIDGYKVSHYIHDITPVAKDETDEFNNEDIDTVYGNLLPIFEKGDSVFIVGDFPIPCQVLGVAGIENGEIYYDLMTSDGEEIVEEERNLSTMSRRGRNKSKNYQVKAKPVEKIYIGAVSYIGYDKQVQYRICSLEDFVTFLTYKSLYKGLKTLIFKTGHCFPKTNSFSAKDHELLKIHGKKIYPLDVGAKVWVYPKGDWGIVNSIFPNDYQIKFDDGKKEFFKYNELYID